MSSSGKRIEASIFKNDESDNNIITTAIFVYSAFRAFILHHELG
jgi:hypothetical protein